MTFDDAQPAPQADPAEDHRPPLDDSALRAVVARLARPHRSGGHVVERAALLADGADFGALVAWIEAHDGAPEALPAAREARGVSSFGERSPQQPLRFVLPATALA